MLLKCSFRDVTLTGLTFPQNKLRVNKEVQTPIKSLLKFHISYCGNAMKFHQQKCNRSKKY